MTQRLKSYILYLLPDSFYVRIQYWLHFHRFLSMRNPKRFTEKIQWLKINNRNPLLTELVDKYSVRNYISEQIGREYLIPLLGHWESANEINFNQLPSQFVLKTTHDSGGVIICKDKQNLNISRTVDKLNSHLKLNVFNVTREWQYKNVKPSIIAEKLLNPLEDADLQNYRWYCFMGKPTFCQVIRNRSNDEGIVFYDTSWVNISMYLAAQTLGKRNSHKSIPRPDKLEVMIQIASELSEGQQFLRIDLYEVDNKIYYGEIKTTPINDFEKNNYERWLGMEKSVINNKKTAQKKETNNKALNNEPELACGGKLLNGNLPHISEFDIRDFKFFCFNGKVKFLKVDFNRFSNHGANYFDLDWNLLPFSEELYPSDANKIINRPKNFNKMIEIAGKLAQNHKFVRVDLYNINGTIYFGELTFSPQSGFGRFTPDEYDLKIGNLLDLN